MKNLFAPITKSVNGNVITIETSRLSYLSYTPGPYLVELEIRILSWVLQHVSGNYVEFGVNEGYNAVNVCRNNPDRMIYGIDYMRGCTMPREQQKEKPLPGRAGIQCKDMLNFTLILKNSRTVTLPSEIGMVFIDGDHSYQGVKADTMNVLEQVISGTLIVWHDYNPVQYPHYRVKDFIDAEIAPIMELWRFAGTWLIVGLRK